MKYTKCDRCGRMSEPVSGFTDPEGWKEITISVPYSPYNQKAYSLCPACLEKLGMATAESVKSLGDQIVDIIYEIAEGASQHD